MDNDLYYPGTVVLETIEGEDPGPPAADPGVPGTWAVKAACGAHTALHWGLRRDKRPAV